MLRTITNKALGRSRLLPLWSVLLLFALTGFFPYIAQGQITYTWTGLGGNTNWSNANNWVPFRTTPATTDIIIFNSPGSTLNVTTVQTATIGRLIVSSNTIVNLSTQPPVSPATTNLLSIAGSVGIDLQVDASGQLNITGPNNLGIRLLTGATASISGSMTFTDINATHTLDAADAGAMVFNSGAVFTQNCNGNVFTTAGTNNTIVFASGSKFIARNGASPFGNAPATKVVFQTGSLYSHEHGGLVSLSGRVFADFEMNSAAYNHGNPTAPGTNGFTVDNLTVTAATNFALNMTGGINIRGNLTVNSGLLTFGPAAANSLQFNGSGIQSIGGSGGTITMNGLTNVMVAVNSTVEMRRDLTAGGSLTVNGTLQFDATAARTLSVAGNLSGSGTINMSGGSLAHVLNLSGASNTINAFVTSPTGSSTVNYNANSNQQVFASPNYQNLTISGSGTTKTLLGVTEVNRTFHLQSSTLQVAANSIVVRGNSFISGTLAMNSTAARVELQYVELRGSIGGGVSPQPGRVTIGGDLDINANSNIGVVNLSVAGATRVMPIGGAFRTLTIASAIGSKTFNDLIVTGWGGFYNTANAPLTIGGDLTSLNPNLIWGTGMYTFTGSDNTINLAAGSQATLSDYTLDNATFTGSYTATGTNLVITNAVVSPGGKFKNSTDAFPTILPASTTTRAFNNQSSAIVNKFDRLYASNDVGNSITANNTNLSFTRGANGSLYAIRTRDFAPAPTTAIVRFTLTGSTVTTAADRAGTLMLGSNFIDDASSINARASVDINFKSGNQISVSSSGYNSPSAANPTGEFWWIVNNSAADETYTGPNGANYKINRQTAALWYNGALLKDNLAVTGGAISEIKFVMKDGSGIININNLRINPITQLIAPTDCWYAGRPLNIIATVRTAGPGGAFNEGTTFTIQRSDINGNFNSDLTKDIYGTLTPTNPSSSTSFTISATFPDKYSTVGAKDLGDKYRYRIISSDLLVVSENNNEVMYYIVNAGPETLDPNFNTLATVTASTGRYTTSYWGYRYNSGDAAIIKISGTDNKSSYIPKFSDFPGKGDYHLVAVSTSGCVSNEKKIYINCGATSNLVVNGNFSKRGKVNKGLGLNDINGNGIIEYDQGDFYTAYNQQDPSSTTQLAQGAFTISNNPKLYNGAFCDMSTGNRAPTKDANGNIIDGGDMLITDAKSNGSAILWQQKVTGLKQYTDYVFSFWAASIDNAHQNTLQFGVYVNCYRLGDDIADDYASSCNWAKYSVQVNTGSATELTIGIGNISAQGSGNDVAIDNVEFYECSSGNSTFNSVNRFVWKGYTSDWFKSDNWGVCEPLLPTCGDDVLIPANLGAGRVYPVINNDGAFARNTAIELGALLTINTGRTLKICGNVDNKGTITGAGSITFVGSTLQTVEGNGVFTNVTVQQASPQKGVTQKSDITIGKELNLTANNFWTINTYTLTLNGTLSPNTGTITGSPSSKLVVGGTGDVTGPLRFTAPATSSSTEQTLGFLQMNRASGGKLTLGTPLKLQSGVLRLDKGIISTSFSPVAPSTSAPILTLDVNSTVTRSGSYVLAVTDSLHGKSGGTDLSHVDGPMAKITNSVNDFIFPVGNVGFLGQIGITPKNSTPTTYVARYVRQSAYTVGTDVEKPTLDHVSYMEYWTLDRTTAGGANGKVTLHWTGYSIVSLLQSHWKELRVARYNGASPSGVTSLGVNQWMNQGPGTGINTNPAVTSGSVSNYNGGYVTSDEVMGFGAFTLASTIPNNPLPVELVSLKASPTQDGKVNVSWITASEGNSSHFLVQHSTDGKHFQTIGRVQAQGENTTALSYQFIHDKPAPFNYYRLSSVDKDASSSLSSIVTAQLQGVALPAPLLYPNPGDGKQFFVKTAYEQSVTVSITSIVGVEVFRQRVVPQQGLLSLRPNLTEGTYLVSLKEGNITSHFKLVVK